MSYSLRSPAKISYRSLQPTGDSTRRIGACWYERTRRIWSIDSGALLLRPMRTQAYERGSYSVYSSRRLLRGSMPVVRHDRICKGRRRNSTRGSVKARFPRTQKRRRPMSRREGLPSERFGHVGPVLVEPTGDAYRARCLVCNTVGPKRETSKRAYAALIALSTSATGKMSSLNTLRVSERHLSGSSVNSGSEASTDSRYKRCIYCYYRRRYISG